MFSENFLWEIFFIWKQEQRQMVIEEWKIVYGEINEALKRLFSRSFFVLGPYDEMWWILGVGVVMLVGKTLDSEIWAWMTSSRSNPLFLSFIFVWKVTLHRAIYHFFCNVLFKLPFLVVDSLICTLTFKHFARLAKI